MALNPFGGLVNVKVGNIDPSVMERALKGLAVRLSNTDLRGDRVLLVHPQTAKVIQKAQRMGKGANIHLTPSEAIKDLLYHDKAGKGLHGGSLWSWLKNKAWPFIKKNILPRVADVAVPAIANYFGHPELSGPARSTVHELTGIGFESDNEDEGGRLIRKSTKVVKKVVKRGKFAKGSEEAKEYMRKVREGHKMKGGSFRMP